MEATDKRVCLLIHGTFDSQTEWVNEGSFLRRRLDDPSKNTIFESFKWSGWNQHRARIRAGERLKRKITNLKSMHPNAELVLISHSHGGNVALYALKDKAVDEAVSALVTLGTPFLRLERRCLADPSRVILICLAVLSGVAWLGQWTVDVEPVGDGRAALK